LREALLKASLAIFLQRKIMLRKSLIKVKLEDLDLEVTTTEVKA
jgi:hypothetical protein